MGVRVRIGFEYESIVRYTDTDVIAPHLCKEGLLDLKNIERFTNDQEFCRSFLRSLDSKDLHVRFARCMRASSEEDRHLGHRYVSAILDGRGSQFADVHTINLSCAYRKRIVEKMTTFVQCIDVHSLSSHMIEVGLLSLDELSQLQRCDSRRKTIYKLFSMLDSKGPTAYFLFAQCLKRENEHPPHKQLYHLISANQDHDITQWHVCLGNRKRDELMLRPNKLTIQEPLIGEEYDQRRRRFESYYHNGQWDMVEKEAAKCKESSIPEIQVIGLLESALSWIFRRCESEVLTLTEEARKMCLSIITHSDNGTILTARCEYL